LNYLAAFIAVPAWACKWITVHLQAKKTAGDTTGLSACVLVVILPVAWIAGETLRGQFFNGFDSLAAGYLLTGWPQRGWLPVIGAHGGGLLFYFSACFASLVWLGRNDAWPVRAVLASAPALMLLTGGAVLDRQAWVGEVQPALSFRLIQGGVPQKMKFDAFEQKRQTIAYVDAVKTTSANLIVTPETAFTDVFGNLDPNLLSSLRSFSSATGSHLFLGAPHADHAGSLKNSVFQISPGSSALARYDKSRLMPFGEYAPAGFSWFTRRMSLALSDQKPGSVTQAPFEIRLPEGTIRIGVLVCHEDLSHADARRWANLQSGLLINPSNLAWFENTWALQQRLQVAQVRALEIGRPVLRVTNTGVTAHIDFKGRVMAALDSDTEGALAGVVQPVTGLTPFARYGMLPVIGLAGILALVAASLVTTSIWNQRKAEASER
jgi:apolipoprotein N-acyltransferase